jgi:hypothetical protein
MTMTSKLSDMLFLNRRFLRACLAHRGGPRHVGACGRDGSAAPMTAMRATRWCGSLELRRDAGRRQEEARMRHRFLAMLPALVLGLAVLPGVAQVCQGMISTSEWRSDQTDRGCWAASFRMRNVSQRSVQVLVIPRGDGAVLSAPVRLAAGRSVKVWPFRTAAWMPPRDVERGVTLQCTVAAG